MIELKDIVANPGLEDAAVIAAVDAALEAGMDGIEHRYSFARLSTASFGYGHKGSLAASLLTLDGGSIDSPRSVLTVWWEPAGTRVVRH